MKPLVTFLFFLFATPVACSQTVKKISIQQLNGYIQNSSKPLVVNFWATFCAPCLEELPYFFEEQGRQPQTELVLVSLDLPDDFPQKVQEVVQKRKFPAHVTLLWLDETNADIFCPYIDSSWSGAIPVTLFVNRATSFRFFSNRPLSREAIKEAYQKLTAAQPRQQRR